jgi:hypothetical protein
LARPGAFKSEKRKKELTRQKKQEKKRQRRLGGKDASPGDAPAEELLPEEASTEEKDTPEGVEETA